jgi:hypothetical protein
MACGETSEDEKSAVSHNDFGKRFSMNCLKGIAVAACFAAFMAVIVPAVNAEDVSWPTAVYFAGPIQIGEQVFPSGPYIIQRCPNVVTRLMKIYSVDRGRWEGLIMGASATRAGDLRDSIVTYEKRGEGEPDRLRYWFFESWNIGMEFPSPRHRTPQAAENGSKLVTIVAQSATR